MPRAAVVAPRGGLLVYPALPACINTLQSPVRSANLPSVEVVPQVRCGKEVPPWYHLLNIRKHCPPTPPPITKASLSAQDLGFFVLLPDIPEELLL